jgi:hypothetical protein
MPSSSKDDSAAMQGGTISMAAHAATNTRQYFSLPWTKPDTVAELNNNDKLDGWVIDNLLWRPTAFDLKIIHSVREIGAKTRYRQRPFA